MTTPPSSPRRKYPEIDGLNLSPTNSSPLMSPLLSPQNSNSALPPLPNHGFLHSRPSSPLQNQTSDQEFNRRTVVISQAISGLASLLIKVSEIEVQDRLETRDHQKRVNSRYDQVEKDLNMLRNEINKVNRRIDAMTAKLAKRALDEQERS